MNAAAAARSPRERPRAGPAPQAASARSGAKSANVAMSGTPAKIATNRAARTGRGFAALEVSLHDILLQSLQRAIWSVRRKFGLGHGPVNPRKLTNSRLAPHADEASGIA